MRGDPVIMSISKDLDDMSVIIIILYSIYSHEKLAVWQSALATTKLNLICMYT